MPRFVCLSWFSLVILNELVRGFHLSKKVTLGFLAASLAILFKSFSDLFHSLPPTRNTFFFCKIVTMNLDRDQRREIAKNKKGKVVIFNYCSKFDTLPISCWFTNFFQNFTGLKTF